MLEKLNDDCQLRIIHYLNLKNQLALKASKNTSERLTANIYQAWQHKKHHLDLDFFAVEPQMIDIFLSAICEKVQSLYFYDRGNSLQILNKYKFPNMRELEFEIPYAHCTQSTHEPIEDKFELLLQLFPSLISLKLINVDMKSLNIGKFKYLRKLDLWECHYYDYLTGSESVEELIIDMGVNENVFYVEVLDSFPKLRSLDMSHDDSSSESTMHDILKLRCNDITELSCYNCIWAYSLTILRSIKNLMRLTLIEEENLTVDDLQTIAFRLPLLEHLDLVRSPLFLTEIHLWKVIGACPSLKILNIDGMLLKTDFFEQSRHYMKQALQTRSVPLKLYCHDTGRNRNLVSNIWCLSLIYVIY